MKRVILRCNSDDDIYPVTQPDRHHALTVVVASPDLWHQRLGHPGHDALHHTLRAYSVHFAGSPSSICHADVELMH